MNLNNIKKDFQKMGDPRMNELSYDSNSFEDFVSVLRQQEKDDEKYMIKNKILPVLVGLILFTMVVFIIPMTNVVFLLGCVAIELSLGFILYYFYRDYKDISNEKFNISLKEFLTIKEKRIRSWKKTRFRDNFIFIVLLLGIYLTIVGNTKFIEELGSVSNLVIFLAIYFIIILLSTVIREYYYRKRFKKKHEPLLKIINDLKDELKEDQ
jgi:hypothetical protein